MDNEIHIKVDGNPYQIHRGANLLEFLKSINIDIPTLCYHPKLSKIGACRLCLVKTNKNSIITACTQEITENMEVITSDEEIESELPPRR